MADGEFVGELDLRSNWKSGYGSMTVARFPRISAK
jgi:hypothetical protein